MCKAWFPGLTSQRHSALISSDSEYFQVCFSAVHYLKISEQRWFSSEQRWKWKISELKISAETVLIFSETELNSADFLWNRSETGNFQSKKKSALTQSCFSAVFLGNSVETPNFQSKNSALNQRCFRENQRWTARKQRWSTLVFLTHSETALINAESFEISETALWDFNPGFV